MLVIHNSGYLHRDIKLENIFWDEESRQYKLGDFGIAKYIGDGDAETKAIYQWIWSTRNRETIAVFL